MYNSNTDSLGLILDVEVFFSLGHCSGALWLKIFESHKKYLVMYICHKMFWKYSGFKCYVCNVQQQQNATNITKISCRILSPRVTASIWTKFTENDLFHSPAYRESVIMIISIILDLLERDKDCNTFNRTLLTLRIVLQSCDQCVRCLQRRVTHDGCISVAVYRCGPAVVTMMTTPGQPLFIISIIMPGPLDQPPHSCAVSGVPV